jgi:hypothetical protein
MGRFCLALRGLKPAALTGCFTRLLHEAEKLQPYITEAVESYRRSVDEQYATVYASLADELRVGREG